MTYQDEFNVLVKAVAHLLVTVTKLMNLH